MLQSEPLHYSKSVSNINHNVNRSLMWILISFKPWFILTKKIVKRPWEGRMEYLSWHRPCLECTTEYLKYDSGARVILLEYETKVERKRGRKTNLLAIWMNSGCVLRAFSSVGNLMNCLRTLRIAFVTDRQHLPTVH